MEYQINCAKVYRKEAHRPHYWTLQPDDDSPDIITAICFGLWVPGEDWHYNFIPF